MVVRIAVTSCTLSRSAPLVIKVASDLKTPRVVAVVQARLGSKRFPNKVLSVINGLTSLEILMTRLKQAKSVDEIVLAIPLRPMY